MSETETPSRLDCFPCLRSRACALIPGWSDANKLPRTERIVNHCCCIALGPQVECGILFSTWAPCSIDGLKCQMVVLEISVWALNGNWNRRALFRIAVFDPIFDYILILHLLKQCSVHVIMYQGYSRVRRSLHTLFKWHFSWVPHDLSYKLFPAFARGTGWCGQISLLQFDRINVA